MIIDLKNNDGYVYAWCVYQIVDENGKTKNDGKFIYIEDIWIHPEHRNESLNDLIVRIATDPQIFNCEWFYYEKRKQGFKVKTYRVDRFLKGVRSNGEKIT